MKWANKTYLLYCYSIIEALLSDDLERRNCTAQAARQLFVSNRGMVFSARSAKQQLQFLQRCLSYAGECEVGVY
jgi:hypothetical protein